MCSLIWLSSWFIESVIREAICVAKASFKAFFPSSLSVTSFVVFFISSHAFVIQFWVAESFVERSDDFNLSAANSVFWDSSSKIRRSYFSMLMIQSRSQYKRIVSAFVFRTSVVFLLVSVLRVLPVEAESKNYPKNRALSLIWKRDSFIVYHKACIIPPNFSSGFRVLFWSVRF